jgi:tetratricopeptide (TPR) repeat protein
MFRDPEGVLEETREAQKRARAGGPELAREVAFCANNIGTSLLALGKLDAARAALEESLKILEALGGAWTDVPLNNLGVLAILESNWEEAERRLAAAGERARDSEDGLFLRGNQAILVSQDDLARACAELEALAGKADGTGDLFHRGVIRYNLGRALLLSGRPKEALQAVKDCPPYHYAVSSDLVRGRRAKLMLEAHEALGQAPPDELVREARVVVESIQPQAWLYRLAWAPGVIEFW